VYVWARSFWCSLDANRGADAETVLERDRFVAFGTALVDAPSEAVDQIARVQGAEQHVRWARGWADRETGLNKDLEYLCIYRWAKYLLALPETEPMLPLFAQAFFTLYFARVRGVFFGPAFFQRQRGADVCVPGCR
jgi:hypothetical protein